MSLKKWVRENYELIGVVCFVVVLVVIGALLAHHNGVRGLSLVSTTTTFLLLIGTYCFLSVEKIVLKMQNILSQFPYVIWLAPILFFSTNLIYSIGNNNFSEVGASKLLLFLLLPTSFTFSRANQGDSLKISWQDFIVILLIWLPFDFRLLNEIWVGKVVYAFNVLVAFSLALILFVGYRKIDGVGFSFRFNKLIIYQGIINFLIFAPIAICIGLITRFLIWSPRNQGILPVFLTMLGIFLFTALPEELLFRGLLQNLLSKTLNNKNIALGIASIVFGLAHLNNAPYPKNITYCFLATLAGVFYGRAYLATNTILAGAITHALVDTVWHELFR